MAGAMRILAFFSTSTASGVQGIFEPRKITITQLLANIISIIILWDGKIIKMVCSSYHGLLPSTSIRQPELTKLMASAWSISF